MKKDPRFYVEKEFGIPMSELEIIYEKTETKHDCSGPSWSHYSWEEITKAIVYHEKMDKVFLVEDDYIDKARNIYNVKIIEFDAKEFTTHPKEWKKSQKLIPFWLR